MPKFKFRTNVKCNGCKAAVTPFLDREPTIDSWKVDIFDPERILVAEGDDLVPETVISLLKQAGYQAELI